MLVKAVFVCCNIKSKYGIIQKKKSQLTLWNALGSSPEKLENEKWPNVPFGVLGHSYFTIEPKVFKKCYN